MVRQVDDTLLNRIDFYDLPQDYIVLLSGILIVVIVKSNA